MKHLMPSFLTAVPDAQVRGTIDRIQVDDQMLTAAHPVVLAPAGVAQSQGDHMHDLRLRLSGSEPIIRYRVQYSTDLPRVYHGI